MLIIITIKLLKHYSEKKFIRRSAVWAFWQWVLGLVYVVNSSIDALEIVLQLSICTWNDHCFLFIQLKSANYRNAQPSSVHYWLFGSTSLKMIMFFCCYPHCKVHKFWILENWVTGNSGFSSLLCFTMVICESVITFSIPFATTHKLLEYLTNIFLQNYYLWKSVLHFHLMFSLI